ncbi:helix-turn-helix domain-containing protein [Pedobacter psychroterrae]|uniref:XRE family transcriptional regulator n=1 Tax=Pedobacter psychroterrae TaxID=2530453 RepID=A0A4R0NS64_9SPHI|nr:helix-turn-helix transcriptional regulator [Pedobacter psychroterrae]TCD02733.1 XRE family transcriptional regulator [Pedobacter psychroterrae]
MDTKFQESPTKVHLGHNVQRVREIVGYKQVTLAEIVNLSQQSISKWEQSEDIPDDVLEKLAKGLGVTAEFIKNFKEEKAIYNIQTNRDESKQNSLNYQPNITYDAADKLVQLLEQFIQEDRVKTESITNLSKAVLDLAEEVKKLKAK